MISMGLLAAAAVAVLAVVLLPGDDTGPTTAKRTGTTLENLMISPETLEFGEVTMGELAYQSFVATNLGEEPIEFEQLRINEPFRVATTGFTLEPGASREIQVAFGNREAGVYDEGLLELMSREYGTATVPLSANIEVPQKVVVEPSTLQFGEVEIGQLASAMLTIRNPGKLPLRIDGLGAIAPFSSSSSTPTTLGPGESVVVEVFYQPEAIGRAQGAFRINSNDPSWPSLSVSLVGVGTPEEPNPRMIASTDAIEFGRVSVGDKRTKWIAVTNRGYSPLMVRSITTEQPFGGPSKGRRLRSGGVYRFPVTFEPSDQGARLAALMIHSNDPEAEPLVISMVGEGVGAGETDYASQDAARSFPISHQTRGENSPYSDLPQWAWDNLGNDPARDPNPPEVNEELAAGDSLMVGDNSKVAIGARGAAMDDYTFRNLEWDGENIVVEGIQLPTIEMPFGDSFAFLEVEGPVTSQWVDGELVLSFEVIMETDSGRTVSIPVEFTTGEAEPVLNRSALHGEKSDCSMVLVAQAEVPADKELQDLVFAGRMNINGGQACL